MRARKKKNCTARLERCDEYMIEKIEIPENNTKPVWLELGAGKGRFAAEMAANNDVLFYAVEIMRDIIVMAVEKAKARDLKNLKYILGTADNINELCPDKSVDVIFLNFSDPWPKSRAAKRRLTYHTYLERYRKLLKEGGHIEFKTDNKPLFDFSVEEIKTHGYEIYDYTEDLHNSGLKLSAMTEYEERFTNLGQPIYSVKAKPIPGYVAPPEEKKKKSEENTENEEKTVENDG